MCLQVPPMGCAAPSPGLTPPPALTLRGRAWRNRALATPRAACCLCTEWPGPGSCKSPNDVLQRKGPQHSLQVCPQARPGSGPKSPSLTCSTAHRAGAPHGDPAPCPLLLPLKVCEGDVWPGQDPVLITVAPVHLPNRHTLRPPPATWHGHSSRKFSQTFILIREHGPHIQERFQSGKFGSDRRF